MAINLTLILAWCGPRTPKNVFMWPAKPRISQKRPASQFEFETPALNGTHCNCNLFFKINCMFLNSLS